MRNLSVMMYANISATSLSLTPATIRSKTGGFPTGIKGGWAAQLQMASGLNHE